MFAGKVPRIIARERAWIISRLEWPLLVVAGVALPSLFVLGYRLYDRLDAIELKQLLQLLAAPTSYHSLFGALGCAVITNIILRRFRRYPGTPIARSILPVLSICYGVLLGIVATVRLDYSSAILVACFIGTLAVLFIIDAGYQRRDSTLFHVVPGGRVARFLDLKGAACVKLEVPKLETLGPGVIVVDLHAELGADWERFIVEAAIAGWPVYHFNQIWESESGRVRIDHPSENGFGALVPSLMYQRFKRGFDLAACLIALPLVIPVIAIIALAVRLDSPGPVFFTQRRIGFRGHEFDLVKFRTMIETNDGRDRERSITRPDDARVTRVGRVLRQTRLDELLQIVNILKGEMSWIGPRPEAVALSRWYEAEIPFYRYRHIVRPGITGWAQVNQGHVASLDDVKVKLEYDFYYIKNLSYWLDIVIALRTMGVIIFGFGAK